MIIKRNIIFCLEKRKKNGIVVEENMPISMRLTFNGIRINFSTGFRIDAPKWDEAKKRVKLAILSVVTYRTTRCLLQPSRLMMICQSN